MGQTHSEVCVVMVPFIAQGHLNQLLHLSRLISAYNLPVHFVCATSHSCQAKLRVQGWDPLALSNIHFHDIPIPSFPNPPPPPPPDPNANIRFPNHLMPSFNAIMHLREPFAKLIRNLTVTTKRVANVHDYVMSSVVQDFVSAPNAELYMFESSSAFTSFWYYWGETQTLKLDDETDLLRAKVPSMEGCFSNEFIEFLVSEDSSCKKNSLGTLTSKVFEEKYMDLLKQEEIRSGTAKNWALGPFNPVTVLDHNKSTSTGSSKLLNWLDKLEPNSVIYVSFGTTVSFTNDEAKEITIGLEESGHKFIWVVREADRADIFNNENIRKVGLPKGMGIPIAAWPMHSDQPRNATLITEVLGTGIYAREWDRRDEKVTRSMVVEAVRRLMASKGGCQVRKKAEELGIAVRRSTEEGGVMRKELDAQRERGEHASASISSETATRSIGRSTIRSQSRQLSASESAFAEEPVQITCQIEEPSHPVFETGADDQPIVQTSQHPEWFSQPKRPPSPDHDWNTTLPAAQGDAQSWISEERHVEEEEEEEDELYKDVNINQGRGIQENLEVEDSHVTLTPVNPDGMESIFETTSQLDVQTPTSVAPLCISAPTMMPSTIATVPQQAKHQFFQQQDDEMMMLIRMKNPPLDQTGGKRDAKKERSPSQQALQRKLLQGALAGLHKSPDLDRRRQKPPSPNRAWNKTVPAIHESIQSWISKLAKQADTRSSFNELMDTPLDFSNFLINRLKVDTLTPKLRVAVEFELRHLWIVSVILIFGLDQ
nr:zeatin O-glucosyltransferase-like [Tanacetum cinerariifolium]